MSRESFPRSTPYRTPTLRSGIPPNTSPPYPRTTRASNYGTNGHFRSLARRDRCLQVSVTGAEFYTYCVPLTVTETQTITPERVYSNINSIYSSFTTFKNLGPLTAPLSFPDDCFSNYYDMNAAYGLLGQHFQEPVTQGCVVSTCCPSQNFYTEDWGWMTSYYSPGVCPSRYMSCSPPPAPATLSADEGEQIVFCCPNDFTCPTSAPGWSYDFCWKKIPKDLKTNIIVMDNPRNQVSLTTRGMTFNTCYEDDSGWCAWAVAYPIQIRLRTASATGAAVSSSVAVQSTPVSSRSRLPTGAVVGIAVGTFVLGICLFAALVYTVLRRRRRSKSERLAESPQQLACRCAHFPHRQSRPSIIHVSVGAMPPGVQYWKQELDGREVASPQGSSQALQIEQSAPVSPRSAG